MKYDKSLLTDIHGSGPGQNTGAYSSKVLTLEDTLKINQRYMGGGMSQNYFAIPWFEYYLDANRFEYIVEFGSQKGCLSTYFANFAGITERVFFDTFELYPEECWFNRPEEGCGHWFEKLANISPHINSFYIDVFEEEAISHVQGNIEQFKTFIFCDGGDKVKEFNNYAPLLKSGDCIAVHDWGHEIDTHNIQETLDSYNLEVDPLFAESASKTGTLIMPFRKV
tara:strand:- start:229 stop:900 length:672 start_codon:yes stop_codon:yes gene_type:complete